ncbi:MAG TPA: N-acetylneuraminate synthase family protein [Nitrososphaeraceae archaeon]|nr:N-acetylneuraminate synthase family protein [Nitrososphaeraceae archaeon]
MIDVAADANANAVKFQLFKANTLYSRFIDPETFNQTKKAELPHEWVPELIDRCKSRDITFLATPFDVESIDYLRGVDIPAVKWASGELNNLRLLSYAAGLGKPMLIATGMSNLGDVELAIDTVKQAGNLGIALLHCISIYPTETSDANLRMMDTLAEAFNYPVGFSDHTLGISVALAAVARGAKIIEKHFTLDRHIDSPDHPFSLRPVELKQLVRSIREVSSSLGTKTKHSIENERKFAAYGRRSLVASKSIAKGTKLTENMISSKRPGTGIPPQYFSLVVGRVLSKDITQDEPILWDHLI